MEQAAALAGALREQVTAAEDTIDGSGDGACGKRSSPASCFCWSDGVLVEAVERGDWVVLDGANLCSAR